jgi:hypothetical protein
MKSLIHKKQALISALLAGLILLNPSTADEQKTQNSINVEISEEISKISIKKVRSLGDQEFSYQNSDKNIILVKCNADKISVKYWYVTEIDSTSTQEATSKMRWHRPIPNSQIQQESKYVCKFNKNH